MAAKTGEGRHRGDSSSFEAEGAEHEVWLLILARRSKHVNMTAPYATIVGGEDTLVAVRNEADGSVGQHKRRRFREREPTKLLHGAVVTDRQQKSSRNMFVESEAEMVDNFPMVSIP